MCVSRFCERLSLSETLFHSMSFGLNGAEWRVHRCRVSSIDRAGALRRWPRRRWRRIRGCRDLARIRCYFLLLRFTIISSFSFLTAQRSHKLIQALLFILTNTYIYIRVFYFRSFSHIPSSFLASFSRLILYSRRNRGLFFARPVILSRSLFPIDQFSLSLSLSRIPADIQRASARCVERSSAISARLSTLHAWSPTPPPLSSGIIPLTRCGQSESRGKGINRHSSESEYALKRYTPESKLSEEEEEDITLYLGSGSGTSRLLRRSIHVHRDNGLPCAI